MSRSLPEKPSLQFLKKQAKELLRTLPGAKLADAQHQLANDYGFASWSQLKARVDSATLTPAQQLQAAVCDMDAERVKDLLARHPDLRSRINDPLPDYGFGQQALYAAVQRSDRATIDVLLANGADIRKRTDWWAGGFGVLDECSPDLLNFLLDRGAVVDAHSASRLGLLDELRQLLDADPQLVHARGGDGQMPLHFASTVQIAELLLAKGADLDTRDVDHESTAAQYMLRVEQRRHYPRDRQDVARYLVSRGCQTDLLMAAALGDMGLVKRLLAADPECIRMRVTEKWFPMQNSRAGGTIYIWKLGPHRTAHTVARDFGHEDVFRVLLSHTPQDLKQELACELGDEAIFHDFVVGHPGIPATLSETDRRKLPEAAQSNNTAAVRLMLEAGWPVNEPGEMGATALHWAAFNGNAAMAREILRFHPALEQKSAEYPGNALSWGIFASGNGTRANSDHAGVVRALLDAGSQVPDNAIELEPSDAVMEMLP